MVRDGSPAFPTVLRTSTGGSAVAAATSHSITLPTHANGNLIAVFLSVNDTPTVSVDTGASSTGWSIVASSTHSTTAHGVLLKLFATSDDHTLTITLSASKTLVYAVYVIDGADSISGTASTSASTDPDAPSHSAGATRNHLWLTAMARGSTGAQTLPSGYSSLVELQHATGGESTISVGQKTANASSDDPSTWTSASTSCVMITAAVWMSTTVTGLLSIEEAKKSWGKGLARLNARDFYIDLDLGANRRIVCCGIRGLNGNYCEAVFAFSTSSAGATDQGEETVEYGNSSATVAQDWLDTFGTAVWWGGAAKTARYVRVTIRMSNSTATDTWTDIRRLWIGNGYSVPEGVDAGWSLDFVDGSLSDRSPQGAVFASQGVTWRRIRVGLTNRDASGLLATWTGSTGPLWVFLAKTGRGAEVVVMPRDDSPYLETVHGQTVDWSPLVMLPGAMVSFEGATFEEIPLEPLS